MTEIGKQTLLILALSGAVLTGVSTLLIADLDMGQALAIYGPTYLLGLALSFLIGMRWGRRIAFTVTAAVAVAAAVVFTVGNGWHPVDMAILLSVFLILPWCLLGVAGSSLRRADRRHPPRGALPSER